MNDLIIIGAGPGGYELALEASKKGLSTILIEASEVGGTCLNSGCIPTKAYYKTASLLKELKQLNNYGITGEYKLDFKKNVLRKNNIVTNLVQGIKFLLKKNNVELVYGKAKLLSKYQVEVNHQVYQANYIVIASGSRAVSLPLPGFEIDGVLSSKELLELNEIPKKLVIIGAGVVGIEFASIFNAFGSEIEVIETQDRILPTIDKEISKRLLQYLKGKGIKFHLKSTVTRIETKGNLKVFYLDKEEEETIACDKVLVSVGRKPNIEDLGLDDLKIDYDKRGIKVNQFFQTNIDNIYAIGDVTGQMMLAHSATYSGYHVLKHILGEESKIDFSILPACVFSFPEVATVGLTEEECAQFDYQVQKYYFKANGKAQTMDETDGFIKIISVDDYIKGVHILGPNASDIIHEAVVLMNKKVSITEANDFIHAHPTLSETFSSALKENH